MAISGNRFEGPQGASWDIWAAGFAASMNSSFGIRPARYQPPATNCTLWRPNGDWRRRSGFARGVFHHQTQPPQVTPAQSRHHRRVLAHVDHRCRPGRAGAGVQHHFQLPLQPLVDLFPRRSAARSRRAGSAWWTAMAAQRSPTVPASHGARGPAGRWCGGWVGEPPRHLRLVAGGMKVKGPGVASLSSRYCLLSTMA